MNNKSHYKSMPNDTLLEIGLETTQRANPDTVKIFTDDQVCFLLIF